MANEHDEKLAGRLGRQLRDTETSVDELTAARLRAARSRALESAGSRPARARIGWTAGGFATAAVAVLAIILWQGDTASTIDFTGDDLDMLAEGDMQLIEDLDFYDWLPEEETAG